MIEICPDLLSARDCLGRTPLRVAAGSAVDPRLIKILAHVCLAACDVQDVDGKTPLHFACDSSSVLFEDVHNNESATPRPPCYDVICAPLSESLAAATIEDADEMNPLEHTIMSNASLKSVKLLQSAAAKHLQGASMSTSLGPTTISLRRVSIHGRRGVMLSVCVCVLVKMLAGCIQRALFRMAMVRHVSIAQPRITTGYQEEVFPTINIVCREEDTIVSFRRRTFTSALFLG